jgi:hypothetical protein
VRSLIDERRGFRPRADKSGGRAGVRLKSSGERVVIEVKRELEDSSFDALATSYQAQTSDYQNVSVRLGFLSCICLTTIGIRPTSGLQ